MKKIIKENQISLSIIFGAIVMFVTILSVQSMKQNSIERQQEEKLRAEADVKYYAELKYNYCLDDAYTDYMNYWNEECSALVKEDNCRNLTSTANRLNEWHKEQKDTCLEMYKLELK
jgi:ABC-type dipeptide/oligopeptide/nickel transport system permease component